MGGYGEVTLDGLVRLLVSHDHQHLAGMQWLLMRLNADLGLALPSSEASPNSVASCKRPRGAFFIVAMMGSAPQPAHLARARDLAGQRWAAPVVDRSGTGDLYLEPRPGPHLDLATAGDAHLDLLAGEPGSLDTTGAGDVQRHHPGGALPQIQVAQPGDVALQPIQRQPAGDDVPVPARESTRSSP